MPAGSPLTVALLSGATPEGAGLAGSPSAGVPQVVQPLGDGVAWLEKVNWNNAIPASGIWISESTERLGQFGRAIVSLSIITALPLDLGPNSLSST